MSDGFNAPNTTQTPDALFAMMPAMNEAELRVTLYLVRQTFGWRREWSKPEHTTTPALARGTGLTEKGVRAGVRDGMDRGTIERANASETRSYTYRIRVAPPFAQSAEGSPQVGVTSGRGHRGLPKGSLQVGVKGSPQVGGLNSKDLTPTLTPTEHPHSVADATQRAASKRGGAVASRVRRKLVADAKAAAPEARDGPFRDVFRAVCRVRLLDPDMLDADTRSNTRRLASALCRRGATDTETILAWGREWYADMARRLRTTPRDVTAPTVAQLTTWFGGRALAESEPEPSAVLQAAPANDDWGWDFEN